MLTEEKFYAFAKDRPEVMRAFYKAVNAIIDFRKEFATSQSGWWATARLKKKEFEAKFLMLHFADRFVFNGQPLSEEEKRHVRHWIVAAANFHMLPKEDRHKVLMEGVEQHADQKQGAALQQLRQAFDHVANAGHPRHRPEGAQGNGQKKESGPYANFRLAALDAAIEKERAPPAKLIKPEDEQNRSISAEDKQWLLDQLGLSEGTGFSSEALFFGSAMFRSIDELKLSARSADFLRNNNIIDIRDLVQKSEAEMLRAPNFGRSALNEIKEALSQMGLHLGMEVRDWPLAEAPPLKSVMFKRVDELELSRRTADCLRNDSIIYIGDLVQKSEADMLKSQNFGQNVINEIKEVLVQLGLHLAMEVRDWARGRIIYVALISSGKAYASKGQHDRAIAEFDTAIRLNPKYAGAFYNRGCSFKKKGDYDRAISDFDEAIRLDPKNADFLALRRAVYDAKGQRAGDIARKNELSDETNDLITTVGLWGLATRFSKAGFVYVVSTVHRREFGGFYQTMIFKHSSTDWRSGRLTNKQTIYRIEVMSQLQSVHEHIDTVRMALSQNEAAWEGTKAYQDEVINAHGRRNECPQEMRWGDKRIRNLISAAGIKYKPGLVASLFLS